MASWSVHFACVVVYEEASVLEVLVREQDCLPSRPCSFALPGCLRTTCSGLLVTETSTCVSGYALRMGFAMKRFSRRDVHVLGMREEGGKRETQELVVVAFFHLRNRILPALRLRELCSRLQCFPLGPISFLTTWFIPAFDSMHSTTVLAWLAGGGIFLQLR